MYFWTELVTDLIHFLIFFPLAKNYILLQLKSCFRDVKLSVDQEMLREEKRTKFFPFVSRSTSRPESGLEATTQGEAAL